MLTIEQLARLPLRSLMAIGARAARRLRPFVVPPEGSEDLKNYDEPIDRAIALAEAFATNSLQGDFQLQSSLAYLAVDSIGVNFSVEHDGQRFMPVVATKIWLLAQAISNTAESAFVQNRGGLVTLDAPAAIGQMLVDRGELQGLGIDSTDLVDAADHDFRLLDLAGTRRFPELGEPIHPGEKGPLGPLWPDGTPDWFVFGQAMRAVRDGQPEPAGDAELVFELNVPEGVSDDELFALVRNLTMVCDESHRSLGGHGLKVRRVEVFGDARVPEGVPLG